jgi:small subunit ribosomal protein S6
MFILKPSLNEEELTKMKTSILEEIKQNQGKVESSQNLGKRRLAFPIKKQKEGYYFFMNFEANPTLVKALRSSYRLNETVLRLLILRKES